jgi:hypothetical protein
MIIFFSISHINAGYHLVLDHRFETEDANYTTDEVIATQGCRHENRCWYRYYFFTTFDATKQNSPSTNPNAIPNGKPIIIIAIRWCCCMNTSKLAFI